MRRRKFGHPRRINYSVFIRDEKQEKNRFPKNPKFPPRLIKPFPVQRRLVYVRSRTTFRYNGVVERYYIIVISTK